MIRNRLYTVFLNACLVENVFIILNVNVKIQWASTYS